MTLKVTLKHAGILFQILKDLILVQKQTVHHMKVPIFSFLELEEQESGIIIGAHTHFP
jgi:hypothetical protein